MYKYLLTIISLFFIVGCSGGNQSSQENSTVNTTVYFVSTDGNDEQDGLSESSALKTIQKAIDMAEPGHKIYVKAGNYGNQELKFSRSGELEKPIILEGYSKRPGDVQVVTDFDHTSTHDSSKMPLLRGDDRSSGTAILLGGVNYIQIRNIQVTNYRVGLHISSASNGLFENILMSDFGNLDAKYDGKGVYMTGNSSNNLIQNVTVINAGAEGMFIAGNENILDSVRVYSDDNSTGIKSATDYYVVLTGANNSIVRNSYIERVGDLAHKGHGFSIKGHNTGNKIHDNVAVNLDNGGFVARHRGTKDNIFSNNSVSGGTIGIMARDGASYNTFEDIQISDTRDAIVLMDTTEDGGKRSGGNYNLFKNIDISDTRRAVFSFNGNTYTDSKSTGNVFENISIKGSEYLLEGGHISVENTLTNSSIEDVEKFIFFRKGVVSSDIDFAIVETSTKNVGF